jgi:hypothetical protein
MPTKNDALGTRLTIQALHDSPASGVLLKMPANWQTAPLSPDLEDRTSAPGNTTPPLMDRIQAGLNMFGQKAQAAWQQRGTLWGQQPVTDSIASAPQSRLKPIIPVR